MTDSAHEMGLRRRSRAENRQWLAVYVKSRHERKIADRLSAAGVETYLPEVTAVRQWSDRRKKVVLPLLPGYLFVRVDAHEQQWVQQETGVVCYVRHEGRPAQLRDAEIEVLRQVVANGYAVQLAGENRDWEAGDVARISAGAFAGNDLEVLKELDNGEVMLCFEQFDQSIVIRAPKGMLEPVQNPAT